MANTMTIQPGQTLSGIAAQNGTTVQALMQANPSISNPNLIFAGNTLNLPGQPQSTGGGQNTMTIQPGQTLSGIAAQNGTTVQALMQANPSISNPNLIFAGNKLNLPSQTQAQQQKPQQQTPVDQTQLTPLAGTPSFSNLSPLQQLYEQYLSQLQIQQQPSGPLTLGSNSGNGGTGGARFGGR